MQSAVSSQQSAVSSQQSAVSSSFLYRLIRYICNLPVRAYRRIFRYILRRINRHRLTNKNFSVISNNCTGAVILSELGQRFDSPTVNLFFSGEDFVKFCEDLKYYISCELEERLNPGVNYPVGTLGSGEKMIAVKFLHYENFTQAKEKWDIRKKRIHWDNIYVIMDDCSSIEPKNIETMRKFDALSYRKILLTRHEYGGVKSVLRFIHPDWFSVGIPFLWEYKSRLSFKKRYDDWDYVSFFNSR